MGASTKSGILLKKCIRAVDNDALACYNNANPVIWRWKVRYLRGPLGRFFMAAISFHIHLFPYVYWIRSQEPYPLEGDGLVNCGTLSFRLLQVRYPVQAQLVQTVWIESAWYELRSLRIHRYHRMPPQSDALRCRIKQA